MCASCVAQGGLYLGGAVVSLRVMGTRAAARRATSRPSEPPVEPSTETSIEASTEAERSVPAS